MRMDVVYTRLERRALWSTLIFQILGVKVNRAIKGITNAIVVSKVIFAIISSINGLRS